MHRTLAISVGLMITAVSMALLPSATAGANNSGRTEKTDSPSGLPVPRFVATRKDEVYARFGPSFDYPIAYEFKRQGLPLKVIAEDRGNIWRRVEDRDGRRMWIHRSMLSDNTSAIVMSQSLIMRADPSEKSKPRAKLTKGVITQLETCEEQWCRVRAHEIRGWVPKASLWGAPI